MKVDGVNPLTAVPPEKAPALQHATREFEAIFIRQMLQSAHIMGKTENAYAGIATDALATTLTESGGIGLARKLEEATREPQSHSSVPATIRSPG